ncbi:MFS general substrate transporter [Hyaloscypha variabilis F]|uniref:MFS general substrate transporter n=1 Tax=Hyaloscypha variabilis (strain UAMH 11265 / GT02V1 / F) TaxID=1149755 RepID=A0A2J6QUA7_HYAVF|nr:MFS general substrate transporter [Hyaloscypha variabilis F]
MDDLRAYKSRITRKVRPGLLSVCSLVDNLLVDRSTYKPAPPDTQSFPSETVTKWQRLWKLRSRPTAAGDSSVTEEKPKTKWYAYIWDTFDKSPEERRFLTKLDAGLLTTACLGYFIKYLDQSNLFNAFVSGMRHDLAMNGNQLNYTITTWTVGYLIGEIPSGLLLARVRPSIWLPTLQIAWSVLTMLLARVRNVNQLYALRFLIGLTEAGFYPGVFYMMGSWYKKDELAKRVSIFAVASSIASMFSGYLMSSLYIMDGVISLPIAFASYFLLPDFPFNTRVFYLNENDKRLAIERTADRPKRQPYTKAKLLKIAKGWHVYLLPLLFLFSGAAAAGTAQPIFQLFLQSSTHPKYSIRQVNNYPTLANGFSIITTLAYAWISDGFLNGRRWPVLLWAIIVNFITFTSLAIWNIPLGWKWACYIISGQVVTISPLSMAWGNEIVNDDEEERALVVAAMNDSAYIVGIWLILIIWDTTDAPRYQKGFITASVFSVFAAVLTFLVRYLHQRDLRRKQSEAAEVTEVNEISSNQEKKSDDAGQV